MLALVKTPHTQNEICIHGVDAQEIINYLKQRWEVSQISPEEKLLDANRTAFDKANRWRVLLGYRLKNEMTQKQLAAATGIRQSVLSEYERGKRPVTMAAAEKLAKVLHTKPENLVSRN